MRPPTACKFCRSRRRKCDLSEKGPGPCSLCSKHNVSCIPTSYSVTPARLPALESHAPSNSPDRMPVKASTSSSHVLQSAPWRPDPQITSFPHGLPSPQSTSQHPNPQQIELPPRAVCQALVGLYFDYVHDQFHTLFQKPAFMSGLAGNQIPPVILYAVVALSARFSTHEYFAGVAPRERSHQYMRRAAALLDLTNVSLSTVQACVLIGACRIVEGDAAGESVYYGIAARMAQLLDLPNRPCETRLEREINLRVWHTLVMIDEWSSTGVNVPRQIAQPPDVPLPMEEMAFLQLRQQDYDAYANTSANNSSSLLGQMIILNRILSDVNRLNSITVEQRTTTPDVLHIQHLADRLSDWQIALPPYMDDKPENLAHYAAQGLGRIYVAVYLGYYHFGQLLYYPFLHGDDENSGDETKKIFAERCKYFSAALCNMVYSSWDLPGSDVLYNMVGHVLVIASSVQIHTLLFSADETEIEASRERLKRNFNILLTLRDIWPSCRFSLARLAVFQKACRHSMDTSFRLDEWMLRFLSEFAKPVGDKEDSAIGEIAPGWSIGDIAITPTSDFGVESMAALLRTDSVP